MITYQPEGFDDKQFYQDGKVVEYAEDENDKEKENQSSKSPGPEPEEETN